MPQILFKDSKNFSLQEHQKRDSFEKVFVVDRGFRRQVTLFITTSALFDRTQQTIQHALSFFYDLVVSSSITLLLYYPGIAARHSLK